MLGGSAIYGIFYYLMGRDKRALAPFARCAQFCHGRNATFIDYLSTEIYLQSIYKAFCLGADAGGS